MYVLTGACGKCRSGLNKRGYTNAPQQNRATTATANNPTVFHTTPVLTIAHAAYRCVKNEIAAAPTSTALFDTAMCTRIYLF